VKSVIVGESAASFRPTLCDFRDGPNAPLIGNKKFTMPDNVLIPLPGFQLPGDFPWKVGFVAMVDDQLRRLRATGHFLPPRFFG
jgi:hypothetical protein